MEDGGGMVEDGVMAAGCGRWGRLFPENGTYEFILFDESQREGVG